MRIKNTSKQNVAFRIDGKNYSVSPRNTITVDDKYQQEVEEILLKKPELELFLDSQREIEYHLRSEKDETMEEVRSLIQSMYDGQVLDLQRKSQQWVKHSDKHTTVGGSNVEEIEIKGITEDDKCFVTINTSGSSPVIIVEQRCEDDKLVVTFNSDPADDHIVQYLIV